MFEGVTNFLDKVSDVLWRNWKLKLVRDPAVNILLKEGEERKVEPGALGIKTLKNVLYGLNMLACKTSPTS